MKKKGHFIKFTIATAGMLHVINKWIDSNSIVKQSSTTSGKYYHWKHGDIYYKVTGTGKPLLLLHDLSPYSASFEWADLVNSLKNEYTVYTLDLPGCGKSDKPAITFTNYFFVQLISDFVRDIIKESPYTAAVGLSSSFALLANQMEPGLLRSIIMINPLGISQLNKQPDRRSKVIQTLFDLPFIGTALYYFITSHMNTEHYWMEKQTFDPFCVEPRILKASYDASHTGNGFGKYLLASVLGNYTYADISVSLSAARYPIHVIFGDNVTRYHDTINEYRRLNENITAEIIEDCKMSPHIEAVEDMIESFYNYL